MPFLTGSSRFSSLSLHRQLQELQRQKEQERERLERERQERERLERERQEREMLERERQERERLERERQERENAERERQERLERERQEQEQLEREKQERERERERAERELLLERERQEREQQEQLDREQMDWERGRRISNAGERPPPLFSFRSPSQRWHQSAGAPPTASWSGGAVSTAGFSCTSEPMSGRALGLETKAGIFFEKLFLFRLVFSRPSPAVSPNRVSVRTRLGSLWLPVHLSRVWTRLGNSLVGPGGFGERVDSPPLHGLFRRPGGGH